MRFNKCAHYNAITGQSWKDSIKAHNTIDDLIIHGLTKDQSFALHKVFISMMDEKYPNQNLNNRFCQIEANLIENADIENGHYEYDNSVLHLGSNTKLIFHFYKHSFLESMRNMDVKIHDVQNQLNVNVSDVKASLEGVNPRFTTNIVAAVSIIVAYVGYNMLLAKRKLSDNDRQSSNHVKDQEIQTSTELKADTTISGSTLEMAEKVENCKPVNAELQRQHK
ncbi:hypothetical protein ROZALSC1DRAFT_26495 [Rozella allomycis CSF55]|uniref:Uncharacterized protein n=1 Tax=Rozella allomycis (strain CSF55) TaxID=988480 RepID=A0A075B0P9_ROZAC|nr:hypothetical protein O9G_003887 [Rozella allomycis CSF55]RKP22112.1 hypothetical protein ROZALSC1DRAFT_26495 [Rozella allomycis CSF55]|eukprot:EPZ35972.1 hypothetical protein O9G_003887 [Rozella allomycis CSF55]